MDDLVSLPAGELLRRYRTQALSPVEVTEAVLARIDALNPTLNAFVTVTPDLALEGARAAEAAYRGGDVGGTLLGVPVSIKDLTPTKGIRTTRGSLLYRDWVPDFDPPIMERLYGSGAVMLGKTNTPEFGWKGESTNRVFGSSRNPWNPERTPGGSSGGAAAAVAAGMGPLAQGSDGAGSIRIPASFCGLVGFKPSFGLVPQYPSSAVEPLSHLGPIARTVEDCALFLDAVAGGDQRDRNSLGYPRGPRFAAAIEGGIAGLRVAYSPNLGYAWVSPEVAQVVADAIPVFRDLGCTVEEANPGLPNPWPFLGALWDGLLSGAMRSLTPEQRSLLDPGFARTLESGGMLSAADLATALQGMAEYYDGMRRFMERYDLLVTPTLPVTAFPVGLDTPPTREDQPGEGLDWTPFTYPFNLTGQPAITLPAGLAPDGLPVGLQIVGRRADDTTVLRAGRAFERARPFTAQPAL